MLVSDLPFPKVKPGNRTGLLLAAMPVIAIILLIGMVAAVDWWTAVSAKSQAREQLLRDALWVEQTFRFQLASDEDSVAALALDIGENPSGVETFLSRSRVFLVGTPEIISINWITAKREIRASLPLRSTAAPIILNFMDVIGSLTGALLPTGHAREDINGGHVSCVDVAMPMILLRASDLGLRGDETKAEIDGRDRWQQTAVRPPRTDPH